MRENSPRYEAPDRGLAQSLDDARKGLRMIEEPAAVDGKIHLAGTLQPLLRGPGKGALEQLPDTVSDEAAYVPERERRLVQAGA